MTPFLKQVADHYFLAGQMKDSCFVFPNRRSMAFFRKYLQDAVADPAVNAAAQGRVRPFPVPVMLTIGDFFSRVDGAAPADRVTLLLELYAEYARLNPRAESLDDFIFWGDTLLSDFNDTDLYLVDPERLFTQIVDLKNLEDTFSYLTPAQREAVETFVRHFREGSRLKTDPSAPQPDVKGRFVQIWDLLGPLYKAFRSRLTAGGLAYEGMIARRVAERLGKESVADVAGPAFPGCTRFVFVGLNALHACERVLLRKLRDAGMAEFCWDYCTPMIRDPRGRASVFMREQIRQFPPSWPLEPEEGTATRFHVISVPSATGQAKQLPGILRQIADAHAGGDLSQVGSLAGSGTDCAVVLPDASLLIPVLNAIPPEIADINVTMGYPMNASGFYALLCDAASLQLHLRKRPDGWYFYHRQVWKIFSDGVFRQAAGEEGEALAGRVRQAAEYYVPEARFRGHPVLETIFRPVVTEPSAEDAGQNRRLAEYLQTVIGTVAPALREDPGMAPELAFARKCHACLELLRGKDLAVRPATFIRLFMQLMGGQSVPFEGEPLKGLQVMGPLETRALDFTHLVILSCNEGVFPRRSLSASFITPPLRRAFGLPSYEYQDAVWAYYFYRMIQRAEQVWLLYDARTEKMRSGEESRYIKQLRYQFRVPLELGFAGAGTRVSGAEPDPAKPADIALRLQETPLSATALQYYLSCPARFFYHTVERLGTDTEVTESLDARMVGNVYHGVMQALFLGEEAMDPDFDLSRRALDAAVRSGRFVPLERVSGAYLQGWLSRKGALKARIRSLVQEQLHTVEVSGRNLVLEDVILQYVCRTLERDGELLRAQGSSGFTVLGLELERTWQFAGFRFKGYIDRMDSLVPGQVRIVDYKTGRVEDADIRIDDANAVEVAGRLFGPDNKRRPKIALQLFLYDMFAREMPQVGEQALVNALYPAGSLFTTGIRTAAVSRVFCREVKERLRGVLAEMADPSIPFRRTADRENTCVHCDFKNICGR